MVKFRHFLAFLTYFSSLCRKNDYLSVFTAYFYNLNIFLEVHVYYDVTPCAYTHAAHAPKFHFAQKYPSRYSNESSHCAQCIFNISKT